MTQPCQNNQSMYGYGCACNNCRHRAAARRRENRKDKSLTPKPKPMQIDLDNANCKGKPTAWWFPPIARNRSIGKQYATVLHEGRVRKPAEIALMLCMSCTERTACREWAVAQGSELHGIWAATTEVQRRDIRRFQRQNQQTA